MLGSEATVPRGEGPVRRLAIGSGGHRPALTKGVNPCTPRLHGLEPRRTSASDVFIPEPGPRPPEREHGPRNGEARKSNGMSPAPCLSQHQEGGPNRDFDAPKDLEGTYSRTAPCETTDRDDLLPLPKRAE